MPDGNRELTLGERRVGVNFNPTENERVKELKTTYAKLIDDLEATRYEGSPDKQRSIARAQTFAEDACMISVKSVFQ